MIIINKKQKLKTNDNDSLEELSDDVIKNIVKVFGVFGVPLNEMEQERFDSARKRISSQNIYPQGLI